MIDSINSLIKELPDKKLKDILLKVKILAFKIRNDKLKEWVEDELNGYVGKEVPSYRKIPTAAFGNLIKMTGDGTILTKNNHPLPYEYLEKDLREALIGIGMNSSVSELEHMLEEDEVYFRIIIPHSVHSQITKLFKNGWMVDSAWLRISLRNIDGIITSIKSNLLTFLIELADEIGEKENIDVMEHEEKIDSLFEKTIGTLSGETVNISIGTDNIQSVSMGDNAKVNVAKGEKIEQTINVEARVELANFIKELKSQLDNLSLGADEKQDIENEITRVETQLSRDKPKYLIVKEALLVIRGILMGVTSNVITNPLLGELASILTGFGIDGI